MNHSLSVLVFANLILVGTAKEKAQRILPHNQAYLNSLGMCIAVEKCAFFEIRPMKDTWYMIHSDLSLSNGDKIPYSAANSSLRYLGEQISQRSMLHYKYIVNQLASTLERCRVLNWNHTKNCSLPPNIIPHFLHKAILAIPPQHPGPGPIHPKTHESGSSLLHEHPKRSFLLH